MSLKAGKSNRGKWLWGLAALLAAIFLAELYLIAGLQKPGPREPAAAATAPVKPGAKKPPAGKGFLVVIDPGHTPEEYGAVSARGTPEREFNQRMAALIMNVLADNGMQALLTNGPDQSVTLHDRPAIANRAGASLFLSVHHDSSEEKEKLYWKYKGKKLLYCDRYQGYSLFISDKPETLEGSLRFAKIVGGELQARGFTPCLQHSDPSKGEDPRLIDPELGIYIYPELVVLRETQMPAVLIEYGFIVNRREEKSLLDPKIQAALTEATAAAVMEYKRDSGAKGQ